MNHFVWEKGDSCELQRFGRLSALELEGRICGFPHFKCYSKHNVYIRGPRTTEWYYARAHTGRSYISRKLHKKFGVHWVVEFDADISIGFDMEMILYHELAHFLCRAINKNAPSHGLLWATSFDALACIMDLDEFSIYEGTSWLFETDKSEIQQTLQRENIKLASQWHEVRRHTQSIIRDAIRRQEGPLLYSDLLFLINFATQKGKNMRACYDPSHRSNFPEIISQQKVAPRSRLHMSQIKSRML